MNIRIGNQVYTEDEVRVLEKAGLLQIGQKNDPASVTTSAVPFNGPRQSGSGVDSTTQFGLFSSPGARPERFSAIPGVRSGAIFPMRPSEYTNETLEVMTGQTADGTTNAAGFTGNPPVAGQLKTARQTYSWGSFYGKTNLLAIPLIGQRRNYGDIPGRIMNMGGNLNPFIPEILFQMMNPANTLGKELLEFGIGMQRSTELVAYRGQALTDNSRFGWFFEFAGLDTLIATGKADSITNLAAPALDSIVSAFSAPIGSTDANGRTIVEAITDVVYAIRDRVRQAWGEGSTVSIELHMRPEMYRVLMDNWLENYALYRLTGAAATPVNLSAMELQNMRTGLFNNRQIIVDGELLPVKLTEGIELQRADANDYTSDILVMASDVAGQQNVSGEYFKMDNPAINEFVAFAGGVDDIRVINDGMFVVGYRGTGLSKEYHFGARMRLVPEFTWLMGRIDDISFTYTAQTRTAYPDLTFLYADGGVTYRS